VSSSPPTTLGRRCRRENLLPGSVPFFFGILGAISEASGRRPDYSAKAEKNPAESPAVSLTPPRCSAVPADPPLCANDR